MGDSEQQERDGRRPKNNGELITVSLQAATGRIVHVEKCTDHVM
jgi:hypothetical protein